jgi:uncharacterized membrane protein
MNKQAVKPKFTTAKHVDGCSHRGQARKSFYVKCPDKKHEEKQMTLESTKNLGGIGALILFISAIVSLVHNVIGGVLALISMILILIALSRLSKIYNDARIFTNALYGFIIAVVGAFIAVGVAIFAVLSNLNNIKDVIYQIYPNWDGNWASLSGMTPDTSNLNPQDMLPLIASLVVLALLVLAILWFVSIISSFFIRRSLNVVKEKTNVGLFGTAGLLLLIGAFLLILFGFGAILMWIAALLLAIAFFQIKQSEPTVATAPAAQYPPPPPTTT